MQQLTVSGPDGTDWDSASGIWCLRNAASPQNGKSTTFYPVRWHAPEHQYNNIIVDILCKMYQNTIKLKVRYWYDGLIIAGTGGGGIMQPSHMIFFSDVTGERLGCLR